MFCRHCGKEIADEAVVCIGCGRPVQPVKVTPPPVPMLGDDKWSSGTMTGLVIGSVFIPLLGIILGVIYMSNNATSPERKKQAKTLLIVACSIIGAWILLYALIFIVAALA